MIEMVSDEEVIRYNENKNFEMYVRHFDTDIAWFLKSPDRFKATILQATQLQVLTFLSPFLWVKPK